jgi:hypothetical protein
MITNVNRVEVKVGADWLVSAPPSGAAAAAPPAGAVAKDLAQGFASVEAPHNEAANTRLIHVMNYFICILRGTLFVISGAQAIAAMSLCRRIFYKYA